MKKKPFSEIPCLTGERITLRRLTQDDADGLRRLTESEEVYRFLPTFLLEKQFDDAREVIEQLYDKGLKESLILGVFMDDIFCGLAEIYGYRSQQMKASVGYRLLPAYWGRGIAAEALDLMVGYLLNDTDVENVTASTMVENHASANVLIKNGFKRVMHGVQEDWGFPTPTAADKWLRTGDN